MPVLFAPSPAVPGQPMNFRAEAKSETSIGLSWSPPRQESIIKYELLFREGDHGREVRGGVGGGGGGLALAPGSHSGRLSCLPEPVPECLSSPLLFAPVRC